jgi:hypothetical protein
MKMPWIQIGHYFAAPQPNLCANTEARNAQVWQAANSIPEVIHTKLPAALLEWAEQ